MNEKSEKAIKSIGRSLANVNKQIDILRQEYPEAMMYVEDGTHYNVMKGEPHTNDLDPVMIQENVLESFEVKYSDCGAW